MITQAELKSILVYNTITGAFSRVADGSSAGSTDSYGYTVIGVKGKNYKAHRLAWLYMTGKWPKEQIDHTDRDKSNNAWSNLREATNTENNQNVGLKVSNSSGVVGVYWNGTAAKWQAQARHNKKRVYLGRFETLESAEAVYNSFVKEHYGAFAAQI